MYANVVAEIDAGEGLTIPFDAVLSIGIANVGLYRQGIRKTCNLDSFKLAGSLLIRRTRTRNATIKSPAVCKRESVLFQARTS